MTRRALVLGSGGLTGVAWLAGLLSGLADEGVRLEGAERIIGTSAGAVVGARLALGTPLAELLAASQRPFRARLTPMALARLIAAQLWPSRRQALLWLGRIAPAAAQVGEAEFLDWFGSDWSPWPEQLTVVAVDAHRGRPAYFTRSSGVDLRRAVAASCAMPGVFPPVNVDGHPFLDGGLRSPANADLAQDCERVLVLAPHHRSLRTHRRPDRQLAALDARTLLVTPSVIPEVGVESLAKVADEAFADGVAVAPAVAELWGDAP